MAASLPFSVVMVLLCVFVLVLVVLVLSESTCFCSNDALSVFFLVGDCGDVFSLAGPIVDTYLSCFPFPFFLRRNLKDVDPSYVIADGRWPI